MTVTIGDVIKQNNEAFWYPLIALPELLAVFLFTTPGLVPFRSPTQTASKENMELIPPSNA